MSASNPQTANTACNLQRVDQFLQSDHYRIEDEELISHLDSCVSCRDYLDSHAADAETWTRAKTLLKTNEYDKAATVAYSVVGSQTAAGHFPYAIQDVLDALAPTDDPHRLGRIGNYEIAGVIGAGAMGVVLKAIDPALDRVIALKVMSPRLANNDTARKRFAREAKAAAAVLHPNVIPIYSVSSDKALPYLVMAYIRGGSLQKRLEKEGPLQLVEILRIGSQIAAGLFAAHEQGLVHRDIKPENILLEEGVERVTITDFGLARAVDDNTVTQLGVIAGTPMYMSPEQARGEQVDQLSDLFSLGSVLYALSTGQPPYRSDSSYGVMRRIIDESPTPIRKLNPAIPEWLACIVERLMAKDKADRFASASEVHKLLEACLSHVQQPNMIALPAIPGNSPAPESRTFFSSRRGILTMLSMTTAAVLMIAAFFMQQERPSITTYGPENSTNPTTAKQAATQPDLIIESHTAKGSDGDGKTLTHHWKLRGQSIGTITVRMLHIENGQSRVVSESVYQGGTKGEQIIELEMQLKNPGDPLPFAGKALIPSLAMSVNGLQSKAQTGERFFLSGEAGAHSHAQSGSLSNEHILMLEGYHTEHVQFEKTLPSMIAASKKRASFLVTTVQWKSADQASNQLVDDLKNIQGTWQATYLEEGGEQLPDMLVAELQHVFEKEALTMIVGKKEKPATYKIDSTTSPKSIDIIKKGETALGIYEIEGDTLRICMAQENKPRPTQFNSQSELGRNALIIFKRKRPSHVGLPEESYSGDRLDVKKAVLNKDGKLEIEYSTLLETMYYCPGANSKMIEQGLELVFVRSQIKNKVKVDHPNDSFKQFGGTITVDPQSKPVYVRSGDKLQKIWEPKANQEAGETGQKLKTSGSVPTQGKWVPDNHSELIDHKALEGNWKAIYFEQAGVTASQKRAKAISMNFDNQEVTITTDDKPKLNTFEINLTKNPISIDIKAADGKIVHGIVDLKEDTLRLCMIEGDAARPTSFNTDPNMKTTSLLIFKREIKHPANVFAADIETDFYRRDDITSANYPDGEIDVEQAREYTQEKRSVELTSVVKFSRETAQVLAQIKGDLWLPDCDINDLSTGVLKELVQKSNGRLYLDKCSRLHETSAQQLVSAQCGLSLSGLEWISVNDATNLAKIKHPLKLGLKELDPATAQALANHGSLLILNKLKKLDEKLAAALAAHQGDLSLNAVTTISQEVAESLGKFNGISLELANLAALDAETARKLSAAKCTESLSLDGLKSITPEVIMILANGNYSLSLQGIVVRDIETRRALDAAAVKLRDVGKTLIWGEVQIEEDVRLGGGA